MISNQLIAMFDVEKENIQLKYELKLFRDILGKVQDVIIKHSPLNSGKHVDVDPELIPVELKSIFQKLTYQNMLDSTRLYNTLK